MELVAKAKKKTIDMDSAMMKAGLWSGVVLVAFLLVAQGFLMHFIPGLGPNMAPEAVKEHFIERRSEIQLGTILQCIAWSFYPTWGIAMTVFMRKMERGYPFLTYSSIALIGGGSVFFILIPMTWGVMALNAETMDAGLMKIMNDWVWFDWLFTWPPFALWMIIIGCAIIRDQNHTKLYPRWVAYYNFWSALFIVPAGLIVYFKTGPFAFDGFGAFWFPVFVFFGWMITMTVTTFQAIAREKAKLEAVAPVDEGPSDGLDAPAVTRERETTPA